MRSLFLVPVAVFALCVLSLPGCGQRSGEVCEVDSDCASGLQCLCKVGSASRGLCLAAGASCAVTGTDTGVTGDDAGRDAASSGDDAATVDGGASDTGASDTGTSDTGTTDTGTTDTGTTDTGTGTDAGDAPDAT